MSKTTKLTLALLVFALVFIGLLKLWAAILAPFAFAALLAYLSNPLVERMVKYKCPRTLAVCLLFLILIIIFALLLLMLIPLLQKQVNYLIAHIPQWVQWLQLTALPWLAQKFNVDLDQSWQDLQSNLKDSWQQVGKVLASTVRSLTLQGSAFIGHLLNLVLVPVVLFYLLRDWHQVLSSVKKALPRQLAPSVLSLAQQCSDVLAAFFRGQLMVMAALAVFYAVSLSLIGLQLGLLIGLLAGLLTIVPYLGFLVGIACALIAGVCQDFSLLHLSLVVIVFVLGNVLEGMLLTPWLVGDKIGLHPVVVIFAIMAGGQLFGFTGVLVALPVVAMLMVLIRFAYQHYLDSDVYA